MKIVVLSPYCDPAGVGLNLNYAINNYTEHSCKGFARQDTPIWNQSLMENYYVYGSGEHYGLLIDALEEADVIHYNHMVDFEAYYARMGNQGNGPPDKSPYFRQNEMMPMMIPGINGMPDINLEALAKKKRMIFHGHGGIWLLGPSPLIKKCNDLGIIMATCSPIDEVVVPGIKWIPNILPISRNIYNPMDRDFGGPLVCSLASNEPLYKGGALVEYIFEWLKCVHEGFDVTFRFVRGEQLCNGLLMRKAHHFTIDNWTQGFHGMSALEGLVFGHVVFSRFDAMAKEKWDNEFDEPIPIVDIKGMDEFAKQLRLYNNDRDLLKEKSLASRKWMEDNYTEEQIVKKWIKLYGGDVKTKQPAGQRKKKTKFDPVKWCIETHGLVPGDAPHTAIYDLTGVRTHKTNSAERLLNLFGEATEDTYIAGIIPIGATIDNRFVTIHEVLKAVADRWELHKFFNDVQCPNGNASFFSLKPLPKKES